MLPQQVLVFCVCLIAYVSAKRENVDIPKYTFQVALETGSNSDSAESVCTGSILSQKLILTTAHCLQNIDVRSGILYAKVGMTKADATSQKYLQRQQVAAVHVPPQYDETELSPYNIAIVELKNPFKINRFVNSILLPKAGAKPKGTAALLGWATSGSTGVNNDAVVDFLTIVNKSECRGVSKFSDKHICLKVRNPHCSRDNGGPIIQAINEQPTIVGIHTYSKTRCGSAPEVGINLAEHLNFFKEHGISAPDDYEDY